MLRTLKSDATPTIWPNHSWYNEKRVVSRRTSLATAKARSVFPLDEKEAAVSEYFSTLNDVMLKLRGNNKIITVKDGDLLGLFSIAMSPSSSKIKYGLTVSFDLSILPFCCDKMLDLKSLSLPTGTKLFNYSQLLSIFDKLEEHYKIMNSEEKCVQTSVNSATKKTLRI